MPTRFLEYATGQQEDLWDLVSGRVPASGWPIPRPEKLLAFAVRRKDIARLGYMTTCQRYTADTTGIAASGP